MLLSEWPFPELVSKGVRGFLAQDADSNRNMKGTGWTAQQQLASSILFLCLLHLALTLILIPVLNSPVLQWWHHSWTKVTESRRGCIKKPFWDRLTLQKNLKQLRASAPTHLAPVSWYNHLSCICFLVAGRHLSLVINNLTEVLF